MIAGDAYNSARQEPARAAAFPRADARGLPRRASRRSSCTATTTRRTGGPPDSRCRTTSRVFPADRVGRAEVVRDGEVVAAVYGRSFARRDVTENLVARLPARGRATRSRSACCTPTSAATPTTRRTRPPRSTTCAPRAWTTGRSATSTSTRSSPQNPWVVYAGSPQGLNPKETGPHGCFVVEISGAGAVSLEHVETAPVAWAQVDARRERRDRSRRRAIAARRARARTCSRAENRAVAARFTLTGRSDAHADLVAAGSARRSCSRTCAPSRARATRGCGSTGSTTARPRAIDLDAVRGGADFAAEVVRLADELGADDAALEAL